MKNIIKVRLDDEHCFKCSGEILARQNENKATALKLCLTEEMLDKWVYIEFTKPDGTKVSTPKLEIDIENKQVIYVITNALTDQVGDIKVEIVIRDADNLVWKSYIKKYIIVESTNASKEVEKECVDIISEAQKTINQAENLDVDLKDNVLTITKKDGTQESTNVKGDDYVITEEDYEEIESNVKTDIQPILENIENTANKAEVIAKGASQALHYLDYQDMVTNFNAFDKNKFSAGRNIMIKKLNVPDMWIYELSEEYVEYTYTTDEDLINLLLSNTGLQVGYYILSALETQKVDLTEYAKKEQFVTLTQAEYDKLTEKSANTFYYIPEQGE